MPKRDDRKPQDVPEWAEPGWFDVTDPQFGAHGDGVSDDTDAIQRAIDTCSDAGGGTVFLPPGSYIVRDTIIVPRSW